MPRPFFCGRPMGRPYSYTRYLVFHTVGARYASPGRGNDGVGPSVTLYQPPMQGAKDRGRAPPRLIREAFGNAPSPTPRGASWRPLCACRAWPGML